VELFESRIAIATLAAFASTACAREGTRARAVAGSAFPVELRDDQGRAVVVRAEPMRIVSLVPSHTETLVALGVGARIVGIDDWSDAPLEATSLPKLGGLYDTHVEEVLALHPDLVLLSESNGAVRALEHAGVTEWAGSAQTFDEIAPAIEAIGKMVGRSAEAAGLVARIGADLAVVEKSVAGEPRVSVYYELDATPYTVGPESFIGVMLVKAGGDNVIPTGLGEFPKISPELVVAKNPAVILGASASEVASRSGWAGIAAVRDGKVFKLLPAENRLVVRPGPRIAEGARILAEHLHPEVHR